MIAGADTRRGIAGAIFVVLKPGVTIADWSKDFAQDKIYAIGTADTSGNYQLDKPLPRERTYSMAILAQELSAGDR